ncbi:MAG: hypothetical protein QW832_03560, partial [archaeon]
TQIVEASVDIDFDILITEISPIDSQIQRWGRIYRNRDKDYDDKNPNILIFAGNLDKGTAAIYDKRVIEKTIEVLENYQDRVLGYEEERKIIKEVFDSKIDEQKTLKDVFAEEIKKNLGWLKYYSAEKRSEAQRIFRRIAGIQVIIPELMENSEDDIEKAFYEVIKDKSNWNLSWEDIEMKVKEKLKSEEKEKVDKWELLKILYQYSANFPIFSFGEDYQFQYQILEKSNFKGFFVLRVGNMNLEEIKKYGINEIKGINIDIDDEEIKEAENII